MKPAVRLTLREKLCLLLSQWVNALFYDGDPSESLSGRAWRLHESSEKWAQLMYRLDRLTSPGHCMRVHMAQQTRDRARQQ
jgi:hypothetical protein